MIIKVPKFIIINSIKENAIKNDKKKIICGKYS